MHFGLPIVSAEDGQWYRRWPEEISYSTSLAETTSGVDAGCVWCRLVLSGLRDARSNDPSSTLDITVRGTAEKWDDWGQRYQSFEVRINGFQAVEGFVHTAPGALEYLQELLNQAKRRN